MNATKKLVELVFEKARIESDSDVVTQQAKHIIDVIEQRFKFKISDRAVRNYHNDLIKKGKQNINISPKIADHLSRYLDYKDYSEFLSENVSIMDKSKKRNPQKALIGSLIVVASYFAYDSMEKKCMKWTRNMVYEKVDCEENNAIPIDEVILNNFKRVEPDCNYLFFKEDGTADLWYGKSINSELEYFNYFGVHPISGKTLKEITPYMIEKHICQSN